MTQEPEDWRQPRLPDIVPSREEMEALVSRAEREAAETAPFWRELNDV